MNDQVTIPSGPVRGPDGRFVSRSELQASVVPDAAPVAPAPPELPVNHWEEKGFAPDISRLCNDFETEPQQFIYGSRTREIIQTVNNARTVQDFDQYSEHEIAEMIDRIRSEVPQVEREIIAFSSQLGRARTVQDDSIDFI